MRQPDLAPAPGGTPARISPAPPYYVVTFAAMLRDLDQTIAAEYATMAAHMVKLARAQKGYLGHDSARGGDGFGITNSYWRDLPSIQAWRQETDHLLAQKLGQEKFYAAYSVHIAKVERAYTYPR